MYNDILVTPWSKFTPPSCKITSPRGRGVDGVPDVAGEVERPPRRRQDVVRAHLRDDAAPVLRDDAPRQSEGARDRVAVVGSQILLLRICEPEGRCQGCRNNCDLK